VPLPMRRIDPRNSFIFSTHDKSDG
jgi:hypothetical protein